MTSTLIPTAYYLKQRNPRWRDVALGFSGESIGNYGSAITCLSVLLNYRSDFVEYNSPLSVNMRLMKSQAYQNQNLIDWSRVPEVFPEARLRYTGYIDCPDDPAPIDVIDALLNARIPVIVKVDADKQRPGIQEHFVVLHGRANNNYVICDPDRDVQTLCPAYRRTPAIAVCAIVQYEAALAEAGLSLMWPVRGIRRINYHFGEERNDYTHEGIDFYAPMRTPVVATMDGIIERTYTGKYYGNCVVLRHTVGDKTYRTYSAHLDSWRIVAGQSVKAGDVIGLSGDTGNSSAPHFHLTLVDASSKVKLRGISLPGCVNPEPYLGESVE